MFAEHPATHNLDAMVHALHPEDSQRWLESAASGDALYRLETTGLLVVARDVAADMTHHALTGRSGRWGTRRW